MLTARDLLEDAQDAIARWGIETIDLVTAAAMIRKEKEAQVTPPVTLPTTQTGTDILQNSPTEPSREPML